MAHPNQAPLSAPARLDAPWGRTLLPYHRGVSPVETSPTSRDAEMPFHQPPPSGHSYPGPRGTKAKHRKPQGRKESSKGTPCGERQVTERAGGDQRPLKEKVLFLDPE